MLTEYMPETRKWNHLRHSMSSASTVFLFTQKYWLFQILVKYCPGSHQLWNNQNGLIYPLNSSSEEPLILFERQWMEDCLYYHFHTLWIFGHAVWQSQRPLRVPSLHINYILSGKLEKFFMAYIDDFFGVHISLVLPLLSARKVFSRMNPK